MGVAKQAFSLAARILVELIEQQEDLSYMYFNRPGLGRSVREARHEYERYLERHEEYLRKQAIKRLREKKMISLRKEGDKVMVRLTKNGRIKALQMLVRSSNGYFVDSRRCLVAFDFPEPAREARSRFRRLLKTLGFEYVQGSVWTIKKDVTDTMREMVALLKIVRWVEVYTIMK